MFVEQAQVAAVVVAFVQLFKFYGFPRQILPVLAGFVGAIYVVLVDFSQPNFSIAVGATHGFMIGLAASGTIGVIKSITREKSAVKDKK